MLPFGAQGQSYKEAPVSVPGKPFLPDVMFSGKARAYASEVPFGCSTLGKAQGHTHNNLTNPEKPAMKKTL